jgi:hypothetical protein
MRPVVVWENAGTETASTRHSVPKTRIPFDGESITTSKKILNKEDGTVFFAKQVREEFRPGNPKFVIGKSIGK